MNALITALSLLFATPKPVPFDPIIEIDFRRLPDSDFTECSRRENYEVTLYSFRGHRRIWNDWRPLWAWGEIVGTDIALDHGRYDTFTSSGGTLVIP